MELILTEENYFSKEVSKIYTGSSEIKDFLKCEACALAKLNGEWEEEKSKAMLVSGYIDEAISGTLDKFKEQNPEIFLKSGELKADYKIADEVLKQMQDDEMFMKYLNGEHQVIMTGEISGVPVKIKIDAYHKDKVIIDLKAVANFNLIWDEKLHQKRNFIDYYDYITQRCDISRDCETKYRETIAIYYSSLYKGKIFTEGFAHDTSRRT